MKKLAHHPELPGTGITAARKRGRIMRLAMAPMKPAKPQLPCDVGLFSDNANQLDLVELARKETA